MRRRAAGAVAWLAAASISGCHGGTARAPASSPPLSPTSLLSDGDTAGFARALAPRALVFPADHGPHPAFRSEWWYFTGIVEAAAPRARFGYQLTIFRQALAPHAETRLSAWATRDIYMAHLTVTDIDGAGGGRQRFFAAERFARDGLGMGGAFAQPFAVWADEWSIAGNKDGELFPARLLARAAEVAIDLRVEAGRGPIAQGDAGLSAKGPQPGNASYYYSCPRLPTQGSIHIGGRAFTVAGESWLDREWSTGALPPTIVGWDWLGVHLSDGRDLMIYRLRDAAGGTGAESRATLIAADGRTRLFAPAAFSLTSQGSWTSRASGVSYPAALRLGIPGDDLDLVIRPLVDDQELRLSVRYWEGAATVSGRAGGKEITGTGYLELTGY